MSLKGEMKMNTLNLRQKTILNTVDANSKANFLSMMEEGMLEEELENTLQDYAGEFYISESDWQVETKQNAYLDLIKSGKKQIKPVTEKKMFVKSDKQIGKIDKVFEKAKKYINFESVVNQYGLVLTDGANGWKNCCCPFPHHDDSSPSFGVNFDSQIFNCFGCHEKGDVIKFISLMESVSATEVAKQIVADNESKEVIEVQCLTLENLSEKLNELLTTFDGQMEATKLNCDKLHLELSTKLSLLYTGNVLNLEKYQKDIATAGIILARYSVFANNFSTGFGTKKELYGLHKLLTKMNEKFSMVRGVK